MFNVSVQSSSDVNDLKEKISLETGIPVSGVKLLNLKKRRAHASGDANSTLLYAFKIPKILKIMGTKKEDIEMGKSTGDNQLPEVLDDLAVFSGAALDHDHDVQTKLMKSIVNTPISSQLMNKPREGKKLLVLDLDHTILDFKGAAQDPSVLNTVHVKRPHVETFLEEVYPHYDLVIWSQTHWRWLDIKLNELGLLLPTKPYKFLFVLDKTCMFRVRQSYLRKGKNVVKKKACKPLQLIWTKFPQFSAKNTLHLDDLATNFCLNPSNGLKCTAYYRKDADTDCELLLWARYLKILSNIADVTKVDHTLWKETLSQSLVKANVSVSK